MLEIYYPSRFYMPKFEVLHVLYRMPTKGDNYQITYTIDDKGAFTVVKKSIMVIIRISNGREMGGCFLPKEWHGLKVRRLVNVPIYEIGK
jgi:hypothetical protein